VSPLRDDGLRVERAAVAATELSLARCAELYMAVPVVDHGADLLAYQADPFRVARIQVKGATSGLPVHQQYALSPFIVSYVLDPLDAADVFLLSGTEAWDLPAGYIAQGGKAKGYDPDDGWYYHFPRRTRLLISMLAQYAATPERWLELFGGTAIPEPAQSSGLGWPATF
jgi:hypothetical protein